MCILDTNVVSELREIRLGKADPHVAQWANSVDAGCLHISAITVFELEISISQLEPKDPRHGTILRTGLDALVLPDFQGRIFPVDAVVARRCARLPVPNPHAERDTEGPVKWDMIPPRPRTPSSVHCPSGKVHCPSVNEAR